MSPTFPYLPQMYHSSCLAIRNDWLLTWPLLAVLCTQQILVHNLYITSALLSHPYVPPSNSMMALVENTLIKSPLTPLCSQGIFETDFVVSTGLMRCSERCYTLVLSAVRGGQSVRKSTWKNTQREKEELELFLCRVSCFLRSMCLPPSRNSTKWEEVKIKDDIKRQQLIFQLK